MIAMILAGVLQHFRKICCCGCSGVGRATTALQPQHHFFRECQYFQGFSNIFRERRGRATPPTAQATFITRENPLEQALFGEQLRAAKMPKNRRQRVRK